MTNYNSTERTLRSSISILILTLGLSAAVLAQTEKRQLTLEWIFGPEGRSVASLP